MSIARGLRKSPLYATSGETELTLQRVLLFINRELAPFLDEVRSRFNERHGAVAKVSADYTVEAGVESVIATAACTVTLLPAADATHYTVLVANGGDITVAVDAADTNAGPATVTDGTARIFIPFSADNTWYGG